MPQPKTIDFNRLPKQSRQRLVDCINRQAPPGPILEERLSVGLAAFGWGFLALCALGAIVLMAAADYGRYYRSPVQSPAMLLGYLLAVFVLAFSVLSIVRRVHLKKQLPFQPGRYLFPLDIVDARDRTLRLVNVGDMTDFRGTHHHTNGAYTHTELRFTFEGGQTQSFSVRGKQLAEQKMEELRNVRARVREAVEARDIETLAALDVFMDARLSDTWDSGFDPTASDGGPVAGELPQISKLRLWLSLGSAVILAFGVWGLRNKLSDDSAFAKVRRMNTPEGYRDYLRSGGWHAKEVRDELLPRAALGEAKKKKSATLLRKVIQEFPSSAVVPEAKSVLHDLFVKARADFEKHANPSDPQVLKFINALLDYEEAHDSPALKVHFHRPSGDILKKTDEVLTKLAKKPVAPIAPHFDAAQAQPRETAITDALTSAFKSIIPGDVLPLEHGEKIAAAGSRFGKYNLKLPNRYGGAAKKDDDDKPEGPAPTIDIKYLVTWSGSLYEDEKTGRGFVGIRVSFDVEMKIPDSAETLRFNLDVKPPQRFVVNWTSYGTRIGTEAPSDERVYQVMALRAFDELGAKLKGVLFRPDFVPKAPAPLKTTRAHDDDDTALD